MRLTTSVLALLPPMLIALLFSTTTALPRDVAKEQRLAEFLAQKPLHTTALLAGAATRTATSTATPKPAMPTTALRSRVMNPPDEGTGYGNEEGLAPEDEGDALMNQELMGRKIEEHIRRIELRELRF